VIYRIHTVLWVLWKTWHQVWFRCGPSSGYWTLLLYPYIFVLSPKCTCFCICEAYLCVQPNHFSWRLKVYFSFLACIIHNKSLWRYLKGTSTLYCALLSYLFRHISKWYIVYSGCAFQIWYAFRQVWRLIFNPEYSIRKSRYVKNSK